MDSKCALNVGLFFPWVSEKHLMSFGMFISFIAENYLKWVYYTYIGVPPVKDSIISCTLEVRVSWMSTVGIFLEKDGVPVLQLL